MATFKYVSGSELIAQNMRTLTDDLRRKVLRGAVAAGAFPIRDAARAKAPVKTGRMRNAIIVKHIPERSNAQQQTYRVMVRSGKKYQKVKRTVVGFDVTSGASAKFSITSNQDAYYWRFVEFGTSKMAAKPFIRPAFAQKKDESLFLIIEYLRQGIRQSAARFKINSKPGSL